MTDRSEPAVAETKRILIRPWRRAEADRLFDMLSRVEVVRWFSTPPKPWQHRKDAVAFIERWAASPAADPRFGTWAEWSADPASRPGA